MHQKPNKPQNRGKNRKKSTNIPDDELARQTAKKYEKLTRELDSMPF